MKHKHITTSAMLAIAAGLGAPVIEMGELRRRQAETDEERQAREAENLRRFNEQRANEQWKIMEAQAKRERRAAKRLSNR